MVAGLDSNLELRQVETVVFDIEPLPAEMHQDVAQAEAAIDLELGNVDQVGPVHVVAPTK